MSIDRFRILCTMALVDGRIDEAEKPVLLKAAAQMGVATEEVAGIVRGLAQGRVTAQVPEDPEHKSALFQQLIEVVIADGTVHPRELAFFERVAPRFGVTPAETTTILTAIRNTLDERARQDMG
jgi:uncharacterized tellurite resistance protein B-like protein